MASNDYAVLAVHDDSLTITIGRQNYTVRFTVEVKDGVRWASLNDSDVKAVRAAGNYSQYQFEDVLAVMLQAVEHPEE
jgi:hypothetical protein